MFHVSAILSCDGYNNSVTDSLNLTVSKTLDTSLVSLQLSHVARPVFWVSDQVRLKSACSASEASLSIDNLDIASTDTILSRERTNRR